MPAGMQRKRLRSASVNLVRTVPQLSGVGVVPRDNGERTKSVDVNLTSADHLLHVDGTWAERIQDLLLSQSVAEVGRYERRAEFPDARLIPVVADSPIRIDALTWVETVMAGSSTTVTVSAIGSPKLSVQELDGVEDRKEQLQREPRGERLHRSRSAGLLAGPGATWRVLDVRDSRRCASG
jgi:hypothetical protein